VKRKVDNSAEDDAPRVPLIDRIRPFVLIFLIILPFALVQAFLSYMYTYRVPVPAGTTVIDASMIETHSWLGKYLDGLAWTGKYPLIKEYLYYRRFVIPNGVTEIMDHTFARNLMHDVQIPRSVKTIGGYAFENCANLHEITIPNGVEIVGRNAFSGAGLTRISFPDSVKEIGFSAFQDCPELREVVLPGSLTEILVRTFSGCKELTDVRIPDSVTEIGDYAFAYCKSLREITIPEHWKFILNHAFCGSGLTRIRIPEGGYDDDPNGSRPRLFDCIFSDCADLREVEIAARVSIPRQTFINCTNLEKVSIPNCRGRIETGAFTACASLKEIDIPDSVVNIGVYAFARCSGLEKVTLGSGLKEIAGHSFSECASLKRIVIPSGVTRILDEVFSGCVSLEEIDLPAGITMIGDHAFAGCANLSGIRIPGSVTCFGAGAFRGCRKLPPVALGRRVEKIYGGAFAGTGCSLTFPSDHPAYRYEDGILYDRSGRELIFCVAAPESGECVVPDGVETVAEYAFSGCTGLKKIVFPDSLKSIGDYAFSGCPDLTDAVFPSSDVSVPWTAFWETRVPHDRIPKKE